MLSPETNKNYGTAPLAFHKTVAAFCKVANAGLPKGIYELDYHLYNDNSTGHVYNYETSELFELFDECYENKGIHGPRDATELLEQTSDTEIITKATQYRLWNSITCINARLAVALPPLLTPQQETVAPMPAVAPIRVPSRAKREPLVVDQRVLVKVGKDWIPGKVTIVNENTYDVRVLLDNGNVALPDKRNVKALK